jgi:colicin import membrane protein
MTNGNNDVRELEDLLTELEGQGALPVGAYSEEEDAVTQLMDAPLGEQEWMVQITPVDRRMMSTDQLVTELGTGHLVTRDMLIWRSGMKDWTPISRVDELRVPVSDQTLASVPERRPVVLAPLPPPAPVPPPRVPSSAVSSPSALGRVPLPPTPSTPFGAPKPPGAMTDMAPPVNGLPTLSSAFSSPAPSPGFSPPSAGFSSPSASAGFAPPAPASIPGGLLPDLDSAFNIPPAAAVPVPPPVTARVNTQRPVAVDFSEMEPSRPAPLRVLVGSGIAAALMIAGTVYALSAGGVFASAPSEPVAVAAASKPPSPPAAAEAIAPKSVEPSAPASAEAQTQPASVKEGEPPAPATEKMAAEKMAADKLAAQEKAAEEKAAEEKAASDAKLAEASEKAASEKATPEKAAAEKAGSEKVAAKGEDSDDAPKAKAQASSDDESSSASAERGSRRSKAARSKKASLDEKEKESAPAPRRSKPRAVVASAGAAQEAGDAPTKEPPGSTFNRDAAKTALDDAAAKARNCRPVGGPSGAGRVQVRYEPNGKVGAVSILSPQFDNTTTGDCVVMVFRRASIPAFTGSPAVVMNKNFEIP